MSDSRRQGNVIVITGPSGVGKGTIIRRILSDGDDIVLSVSATTRSKRPGERDGVEYYFKTVDEFKKLIESGQMLEWATFAGNYYGTFKDAVMDKIFEGKDVILEIEVKGAMQVKNKIPEAVMIFIAPPSIDELKSRLLNRATESEDVIRKRLDIAEKELKKMDEFQYVVVNDDLEKAIEKVKKIIADKRNGIVNCK